ncbi:MAG: TorF family putative porin [Bacteroidota bacterium]
MKNKTTKFLLFASLAILLFLPGRSIAQVETSFNSGVDIMSRYIWRGLDLGGSSPSIQPTLEYNLGNFTLGSWGAFSMSDGLKVQETDLYLSYNIKDIFSLMITDYFYPVDTLENNNYFEYNEDKTSHLLEFSALFNGTEKIPFTLLAAVNFWGDDALKSDGKKQFSTYLELGYNGTIKEVDYNIFLGFTPTSPDQEKGESGFYGPYAGVVNCGITASKKIQITDKFSLPVTTSFIMNPQAENVFLVVGFSL